MKAATRSRRGRRTSDHYHPATRVAESKQLAAGGEEGAFGYGIVTLAMAKIVCRSGTPPALLRPYGNATARFPRASSSAHASGLTGRLRRHRILIAVVMVASLLLGALPGIRLLRGIRSARSCRKRRAGGSRARSFGCGRRSAEKSVAVTGTLQPLESAAATRPAQGMAPPVFGRSKCGRPNPGTNTCSSSTVNWSARIRGPGMVTSSEGKGVIYDQRRSSGAAPSGVGRSPWVTSSSTSSIPARSTIPTRRTASRGPCATRSAKLDHLVQMGINCVLLMPVNEFAGRHSWGYNPSDLFAVESAYGGPDALKEFVKACHERRLAVRLDIVHNHYGPGDLTCRSSTVWRGRQPSPVIYFYEDEARGITHGSRPVRPPRSRGICPRPVRVWRRIPRRRTAFGIPPSTSARSTTERWSMPRARKCSTVLHAPSAANTPARSASPRFGRRPSLRRLLGIRFPHRGRRLGGAATAPRVRRGQAGRGHRPAH